MATTLKENVSKYLGVITRNNDVFLPVGIMGILIIMLIPMPTPLLDILLTFSISLSIIILLVSIYAEQPLDFSSFPFVLLVATLFRLSLNVSTTRVILLHGSEGTGAAGSVIQSFGEFVVGGNYIVGVIVFTILVIINFMVITKGSGRVAEVAARFTLDAMPGKQMAIDADLNAGIIDEVEAKERRETIRKEADFHGSMDGASKFVRGDAIAGLIITVINVLAGFLIGVFQGGLTFTDSIEVFTILTIGDGLVSQIPALVISTSAGIIVTRAGGDDGPLSKQLTAQLFSRPKVLYILGGVLFFFAIIPGMPKLPFLILSGGSIAIGYYMRKGMDKEEVVSEEEQAGQEEQNLPEDEQVKNLLDVDIMELVVGIELIPMTQRDQGGILLDLIMATRKDIARELGFIVPPIRIYDNITITDSREYAIMIRDVQVAKSYVIPDKYLALNMGGNDLNDISGIDFTDPVYSVPGKWVDEFEKSKAEISGLMIIEPVTVISAHLSEVIKNFASELLGRQEVQDLLDRIKAKSPRLVDDIIPGVLDVGGITLILQRLLKEKVSIRNLPTILETLATYSSSPNKNVDYLTDKVRYALRRQICESLLSDSGKLSVFRFQDIIEHAFAKSIHQTDDGSEIILDPTLAIKIVSALVEKVKDVSSPSKVVVVFVQQRIRNVTFKFLNRYLNSKLSQFSSIPLPRVAVLAFEEVPDDVEIEILDLINIIDENQKPPNVRVGKPADGNGAETQQGQPPVDIQGQTSVDAGQPPVDTQGQGSVNAGEPPVDIQGQGSVNAGQPPVDTQGQTSVDGTDIDNSNNQDEPQV